MANKRIELDNKIHPHQLPGVILAAEEGATIVLPRHYLSVMQILACERRRTDLIFELSPNADGSVDRFTYKGKLGKGYDNLPDHLEYCATCKINRQE